MSVRVRYAPSPTGSPHVGNIRTALYNHLFAKRHGGTNILRIEDTDRARLVEGCEDEIIDSLRYVGIEWQEGIGVEGGKHGPYRQSVRKEAGTYGPYWQKLLDSGAAYWAFDTPGELTEMREHQTANKLATGYFGGAWRNATTAQVEDATSASKHGVIRLKIPRNETIVINDAIRGRIEYDSNTIDDPVLIKADGMPTYHFAAMVDDHLMEITHIFRGEEWIGSAPKHIVLFKAFEWTPPVMVHLPVIKGKDGSKLSKRHGDTACLDFRRAGYLGEALANFIALIGWSPGGDREIMSMDEMAEAFDLKGLQPSSGVFDAEKLNWMNGAYIRAEEPTALLDRVVEYAVRPETAQYWSQRPDSGVNLTGLQMLAKAPEALPLLGGGSVSKANRGEGLALDAVGLTQERVTTLADFGEACAFFFADEVEYDPKAVEKWLNEPHVPLLIDYLISEIGDQEEMDWEALLKKAQIHLGIEKLGPIVHPVRIALTGKTTGPGLFELMSVLGVGRISQRLRRYTVST